MDINESREKINQIDDQLIHLFEQRMEAALEIARYKQQNHLPVYDPARERQVLCVTHLQQIAALADRHYLVEKFFDGERTRTRLTLLSGEARVNEIARMLGGDPESARAHAREMLKK